MLSRCPCLAKAEREMRAASKKVPPREEELFPIDYDYTKLKMFEYEWTITNFQMMSYMKYVKGPSSYIDPKNDVELRMSMSKMNPRNFNEIVCVRIDLISNSLLSNTIKEIVIVMVGDDERGKLLFKFNSAPVLTNLQNLKLTETMEFEKLAENGKLIVRLRITVVYENACLEEEENSVYVRKLSHDMKYLLAEGREASDVTVDVNGVKYFLHRFVLYTRCPMLRKLYEMCKSMQSPTQCASNSNISLEYHKESKDSIYINGEDERNFESALAYIYSGYPISISASCWYSFYKFAVKMKLHELVWYLKPSKLRCVNNVEVKTIRVCFPIKHFKSTHYWQSPSFRTTFEENIEWQLEILFDSGYQNGYVTLVKVSDTERFVPAEFKLSIKQQDGAFRVIGNYKHLFPNRASSKVRTNPSSLFGEETVPSQHPTLCDTDSKFIIDESVITDDSLLIACELTLCTGESDFHIRKYPVSYKPLSLKSLTSSFRNVLESSEFSDANFTIGKGTYRVHKAMCITRMTEGSKRLYLYTNLLRLEPMRYVAGNLNGKDFLCYVYAGDTENVEGTNAEAYFTFANRYSLRELQQYCEQIMIKSINKDNISNMLTYAKKECLVRLRTAVRKIKEYHIFYATLE